jgi:serine protease inhibitor
MMQLMDQDFGYADRDGYRMLRLPYGDQGRYGMEVLLPDEGVTLGSVLDSLDAAEWRAAVDSLTEQTVNLLAMPRFELRWEAELNDPLTALGMGAAFGGEADFRPMSPTDPWLDTVVHKTYLRVDEEGTEAAAVTGGAMITSVPADPLEFRVDRPFLLTISDSETGTILFLGVVADPRS